MGSKRSLPLKEAYGMKEYLIGLVAANDDLTILESAQAVIRRDYKEIKTEVKLVTACSAQQQPTYAEFVGPGLLTAAVVGNKFTAPSPANILETITELTTDKSNTVLLIANDYVGIRLNFTVAMRTAADKGIKVQMLLLGNDSNVAAVETSQERIGHPGLILIFKLAGAMAEEGASVQDIAYVCEYAFNNFIATANIRLCQVTTPVVRLVNMFSTPLHIAVGPQKQPGVSSHDVKSLNNLARLLTRRIISSKRRSKFKLTKGCKLALLINNIGGFTRFEEYIFVNKIVEQFCIKKIYVYHIYLGRFQTACDFTGFSLTALKISRIGRHDIYQYLNALAESPSWVMVTLDEEKVKKTMSSVREAYSYPYDLTNESSESVSSGEEEEEIEAPSDDNISILFHTCEKTFKTPSSSTQTLESIHLVDGGTDEIDVIMPTSLDTLFKLPKVQEKPRAWSTRMLDDDDENKEIYKLRESFDTRIMSLRQAALNKKKSFQDPALSEDMATFTGEKRVSKSHYTTESSKEPPMPSNVPSRTFLLTDKPSIVRMKLSSETFKLSPLPTIFTLYSYTLSAKPSGHTVKAQDTTDQLRKILEETIMLEEIQGNSEEDLKMIRCPSHRGTMSSIYTGRGTIPRKGCPRTNSKAGPRIPNSEALLLVHVVCYMIDAAVESENDLNFMDMKRRNFGTKLRRTARVIEKAILTGALNFTRLCSTLNGMGIIFESQLPGIPGTAACLFFVTAAKCFEKLQEHEEVTTRTWLDALRSGVEVLRIYGQFRPDGNDVFGPLLAAIDSAESYFEECPAYGILILHEAALAAMSIVTNLKYEKVYYPDESFDYALPKPDPAAYAVAMLLHTLRECVFLFYD